MPPPPFFFVEYTFLNRELCFKTLYACFYAKSVTKHFKMLVLKL